MIFFEKKTKFYKATARVDVAGLNVSSLSALPLDKKLIILKSLTNSLKLLHEANIVHGDLKLDNILISEPEKNLYVAKLIDFDNSYFSGSPPIKTVGDQVYYSPELGHYNEFPDKMLSSDLQLKSDIFTLGLIFHQYLTGALPSYDTGKYKYAYAAVLNNERLTPIDAVPPKLNALLRQMLEKDYSQRPDIVQIMSWLKEDDIIADMPKKTLKSDPPEPNTGSSRLKMPLELMGEEGARKTKTDPSKKPKSDGLLSIFKAGKT